MNKKENILIASDFDGTITGGFIPPKDAVIITGRKKEDEQEVRRFLAGIQRAELKVYYFPSDLQHTAKNVGVFKAKMVKKLGVKRMYEDNAEQVRIMKEMNPDVDVHLWKFEPKTTRFVLFTSEGTGIPIAHHLQNEGYDVYVGQAETFKELGIESTPEEDKKLKASQDLYKGILKKYSAQKLLSVLKKVPDKENYFIYCDLNSLYVYGEALLKAGFTRGIFPTKEDYEFEKSREDAMKFVEKNYPEIKIIPFQKIKTVEEAKKIVEETQVPLVIQSEGDFVSTIVPPDDLEKNKTEILSALDRFAGDYSKGQIILKEKLINPVEITPQIVFYDGVPVFTDIDIETKNIGDGLNNGNQVGCGTNLIIKTDIKDKINDIAFPKVVYEMAKKHKGIFVWDISIYFTDKGLFFGEFCSNRFGYDAVLTEMCMSGGAGKFLEGIESQKSPLQTTFGAAFRLFNLNKQKDTEITIDDFKNTWVYETTLDKTRWVTIGTYWDLAVATGRGDTIEDAVNQAYEVCSGFSFKEKYYRTKSDFLADYPTSIIHRLNTVNHQYFDVPDYVAKDEIHTMNKKLADLSDKIDKGLRGVETLKQSSQEVNNLRTRLKTKIKSIINAGNS